MASTTGRLLRYLQPFRLKLGLAFALSAVSSALDVFSFVLVIPLLQSLFRTGEILGDGANNLVERALEWAIGDFVRAGAPLDGLRNVCLLLLGAIFVKNLALVAARYVGIGVREGVERDLREAVYSRLLDLPLSFFHRSRAGELITRVLNDPRQAREAASWILLEVFRRLSAAIVYLATLLFLSWRLTLIAALLAPVLAITLAPIVRRLRSGARRAYDTQGQLISMLQESVGGVRLIKASGAEAYERGRFAGASAAYSKRIERTEGLAQVSSPLSEILSSTAAVLLIWLGARMVLVDGSMAPETFIAFITIALQLVSPLKSLADVPARFQLSLAAADRVFEVLDEPDEPDSGTRAVAGIESDIVFDRVSFEYEAGRSVLRDITLRVPSGETVALVGHSGSGKSTFVDLLPRFMDPTSGRILLDGTDLRDYRLTDLRALFGIVSQETLIFHDTVRANIAFGCSERYSDEQVETAARAAHALEFIEQMPGGLEAPLGDRGVRLSGGQRQRIGIARAVLRDPPILILDEATSALDSESEQLIQRALAGLLAGRTVFVIAHRLSTILGADRIVVLDEGSVVEQGRHADLHAVGGAYRRLYDLQLAGSAGGS